MFAMEALSIMIMATYETFATVYDAVMDDSLYDKWTDFSLRHLPKNKERKKLLELACGTGIQSVRFSQAGFKSFKLYADFEDKEPTETSTRWFFVAQK